VSIFQFCFVKLEVRIDMSFVSFVRKKKKKEMLHMYWKRMRRGGQRQLAYKNYGELHV